MPDENGKLTREERIELLRKRQRKDGTPFAKHEGPRKARAISPDGVAVMLAVLGSDEDKVKLLQSFGTDGRKAFKTLLEARPDLEGLYKLSFPRATPASGGQGRPLQAFVRATANGTAVVSGFAPGHAVNVSRNADGSVTLTQGAFIPGRAVAAE